MQTITVFERDVLNSDSAALELALWDAFRRAGVKLKAMPFTARLGPPAIEPPYEIVRSDEQQAWIVRQ